MKFGKTLMDFAQELTRQMNAKKDYLVDTRKMTFDYGTDGGMLSLTNDQTHTTTILGVNDIAHTQIGTALGIPKAYYDKMRRENPELLSQNVNSWFQKDPKERMIRTLDNDVRAFLSKQYRRIDNYPIAMTVLPIIADMQDAKIESCELTDRKMYIKVVNPRLTAEVVTSSRAESSSATAKSAPAVWKFNLWCTGLSAPTVWLSMMRPRSAVMWVAEMWRARISRCTVTKR